MPGRQPLVSFERRRRNGGGKRTLKREGSICVVGAACLLPVGHEAEQEH